MSPATEPDEQFDSACMHGGSAEPPSFGRTRAPSHAREIKDWLHVDLRHAWEVQLWTREFGCTEEQLRRAVAAVGNSARSVRYYLKERH